MSSAQYLNFVSLYVISVMVDLIVFDWRLKSGVLAVACNFRMRSADSNEMTYTDALSVETDSELIGYLF